MITTVPRLQFSNSHLASSTVRRTQPWDAGLPKLRLELVRRELSLLLPYMTEWNMMSLSITKEYCAQQKNFLK